MIDLHLKSMKKILLLCLCFNISGFTLAHTQEAPLINDLVVKVHEHNQSYEVVVGQVQTWNDSSKIHVTYSVPGSSIPSRNWCISETHLSIERIFGNIPQKNGSPIPSQFAYKSDHHPCVHQYTYNIPLSEVDGSFDSELFIAAQAKVKLPGGLEGLEANLPSTATIRVTSPVVGGAAFFPSLTVANDGILNGSYPGWCVDTSHFIVPNTDYQAQVYSSYGPIPPGVVDFPQNFPKVNWILNQNYVGKVAPDSIPYTYGDVQLAIWTLIDDQTSTIGLGPYVQGHVDGIVADAIVHGADFVPSCNQSVAVVLVPKTSDGKAQSIIAQSSVVGLGIPCKTTCEKAWAGCFEFPGKNWGLYFTYRVQ